MKQFYNIFSITKVSTMWTQLTWSHLRLLFNLDYIKHYITVDDLWLKLVEVLSNVPTVVCSLKIEKMREGITDTQAQGLFNKNVGKNENDLYLKDLDKEFSLASKILAYENGKGK